MRRYVFTLLVAALSSPAQVGKIDTQLKPGAIPFELSANKIYVQAKFNGKPASIVLDTGSPMTMLDTDFAARNGFKLTKMGKVSGGGPSQTDFFLGKVETFSLGGLEVKNLGIGGLGLDRIVGIYEGRAMEGVIGNDVLQNFVLEIDYPSRKLTLHEPASFRAPKAAVAVPFKMVQGHLHVQGSVDVSGRTYPGTFVIDTGAKPAVMLNTPFIEKNRLVEAVGKTIPMVVGTGIGGRFTGVVGRLTHLRIGDLTVDNPPANLPIGQAGFFEGKNELGTVGAAIFRKYVLFVDYRGKRLLFMSTKETGQPIDVDMSGLFLVTAFEDRSRVSVSFVGADTPAALAGVREGDHVVEVDGKRGLSAEQIRNRLMVPGKVRLKLERSGEPMEVVLTLKPLV